MQIYRRANSPKRLLVKDERDTYLVPNISGGWDARVRVWYPCEDWQRVEPEREDTLIKMLRIPSLRAPR